MAAKSSRNIQPLSSLGIFLDLTRPYLDRRNRENDLVSISNTIFYETYFSNTLTTMKVAKSRAMSRTEFIFFNFLNLAIYLFISEVAIYWEKLCAIRAETGWTLPNSVISSELFSTHLKKTFPNHDNKSYEDKNQT